MPALVAGIHLLLWPRAKAWMAGTSPAMTDCRYLRRLAARQELAHAVERLQNVLGRIGVGEPHIAFAQHAEIGPADDGDAGVLEQRGGEGLRLPAGALDVRKSVERTPRRGAGDSGQPVEAGDHDGAPPVELRDHLVHRVLRP